MKVIYSHVLVSQDRHEIFLTFAIYDDNYLDYSNGNLAIERPPSLTTMQEFGRWSTLICPDHAI